MYSGDSQLLAKWADRLDAFVVALDAIDADDPFRYCEDAWEIWQTAAKADPPPADSAAVLVVLEALRVLAHAVTTVTVDYYRTPDLRDRMTLSALHAALTDGLDYIREDCRRWLHDGMPDTGEIRARAEAVRASLQAANECGDELRSENSAPGQRSCQGLDTRFSYDRVCTLSEAESKRYREAYDRLRRMLDRELLQHVCDGADTLSTVLSGVVRDLEADRVSLTDDDAMDECKRRIRSALLSVTSALQIHRDQTITTAARTFGVNSAQANTVRTLFNDLARSSFEYRWLEELRDAMQHGDVDAVTYDFPTRLDGRARVDVHLNREYMARLPARTRRTWVRSSELSGLNRDPSIVDMLATAAPKVTALQGLLDEVLYPSVAEDVTLVREFICRFGGRDGSRALHSAAGFTGSRLAAPHLSPRVLAFVRGYQTAR
ncbi:hypothetical protein ACXDF8_19525 [Mycolicibacterium sp. CBM1]